MTSSLTQLERLLKAMTLHGANVRSESLTVDKKELYNWNFKISEYMTPDEWDFMISEYKKEGTDELDFSSFNPVQDIAIVEKTEVNTLNAAFNPTALPQDRMAYYFKKKKKEGETTERKITATKQSRKDQELPKASYTSDDVYWAFSLQDTTVKFNLQWTNEANFNSYYYAPGYDPEVHYQYKIGVNRREPE